MAAPESGDLAGVWQRPEVARKFLDDRALLIPHREEQLALMLQLLRTWRPPARVLDVGCGGGVLLGAVLAAFPEARGVGLDYSPPMLAVARETLAPFSDRVRLDAADLSTPEWTGAAGGAFDAVVSGFCIHHLPDDRKRAVYGEVHDLLAPGGLFVHVEHVASATPELEALFDTAMVAHLHRRRRERGEDVALETVRHEYMTRLDRAANRLAPLELQLQWLRELGFTQVDCVWKWYELALFVGRRPG